MERLIWAEGALLFVVLVAMPMYSIWSARKTGTHLGPRLKGLGLPEGSIRGMLALLSVGSFVILLVLGPGAPEMKEFFDKALAAFGTLTGAIIGFYFGNRGTTTPGPTEPPDSLTTPATTATTATVTGEANAGPIAETGSTRTTEGAQSTAKPQ